MTNEEIISTWMEPKPTLTQEDHEHECGHSPLRWWHWFDEYADPNPMQPRPRDLDLDALHEVEARLPEEQWWAYENYEWDRGAAMGHSHDRVRLHASADQKIKALAAVLRPLVEAK